MPPSNLIFNHHPCHLFKASTTKTVIFLFLHYFALRIIDPDHVNIYVHLLLVNCTQPKKFIAALQRVAEQTYNSIFTVQQMRQIAQVGYSSFKTTLTIKPQLPMKTQISAAVKLIFILEKELSPGKKKSWVQKKQGSTSFRSTLNTCETFRVRSHVAIACLSHFNCKHSNGCYSQGQALALNAINLHASVPCFDPPKK